MFANKKAYSEHGEGYRRTKLFSKSYKTHRIIWLWMTGEWPDQVDHENGVRNDNRWCNLRNVTSLENARNMAKSSKNTSGVVGVHWVERDKAWLASIRINGKLTHLCQSKDKEIATLARKEAEIKYGFHKNHAREQLIKYVPEF